MMLKYLHHSHAHADSQDDSTVFQKPLLHAVDAALGGGKEEAVRRNTARRGGKQRQSRLEKGHCWLGVWAAEGKNNTAQEAEETEGLWRPGTMDPSENKYAGSCVRVVTAPWQAQAGRLTVIGGCLGGRGCFCCGTIPALLSENCS